MDKKAFAELFCKNTQRLRESKRVTQERMATALGVTLNAYKKYETKTPLPHVHIPAFALLCGISIDDLFSVQNRQGSKAAKTAIRVRAANKDDV